MIKPSSEPKDFNLSGLKGISDKTLEMHLALYKGYVKNTFQLTDQLQEMTMKKQASASNPHYSELKRHLGFEYGGMILHEYYFGNLTPGGKGELSKELDKALTDSFGSFQDWQADFMAVGNMRGVGWGVLYYDPTLNNLSNLWITLHDQGVPTSLKPILVMDMWEHAFLLDYKPSEKDRYIEAFFNNVNWNVVNQEFKKVGVMQTKENEGKS